MTTTTKRRPWCPVRSTMWMPDIDLNDIEWDEPGALARIMAKVRNTAAEKPHSNGSREKPLPRQPRQHTRAIRGSKRAR